MGHASWYLLAYDIREQRRLQRVHRYLSKQGIPMQKSVFFIFANTKALRDVIDGVEALIHRREDDVRVYPISHPSQVWLHGYNAFASPEPGKTGTGARLIGAVKSLLRIGHG
jgi:CRISPR-associated endonuclease Cas2